MRHVMRCDSSRAGDTDLETSVRPQYNPSPAVSSAPKVTRVPLKKPMTNGVPVPTKVASAVTTQELKKTPTTKRLGRPPNAVKAEAVSAPPVNYGVTKPTSTSPVVVVAGDTEPKISSAPA
ncbi:hypothetical protein OESDEN_07544 [Oesophagostomum dentatum]|uniref:Uncharacterized protein n=1 Tax=Oesophagostomum dentatum TaxID=61180 RepID=A0A0B1T4S0_OESDE|nr:hypothetical protein OESDEN_07544 [Oesophagostomum dentatum]